MEEFDTIDQQLEAYLSGELSPAAQRAFETELEQDATLRERLNQRLRAKASVWSSGRGEEFQALRKRYVPAETQTAAKTRPMFTRWIAVAAASIALLLALAYLLANRSQVSPQDLYAANYQRPTAPVPRSVTEPNYRQQGHVAFNQQAYEAAIQAYQQQLADTQDLQSYLFMGLSYHEMGEYPAAEQTFRTLASDTLEASWYWAMNALKQGDEPLADSLLKAISQDDRHLFQDKAKQALTSQP